MCVWIKHNITNFKHVIFKLKYSKHFQFLQKIHFFEGIENVLRWTQAHVPSLWSSIWGLGICFPKRQYSVISFPGGGFPGISKRSMRRAISPTYLSSNQNPDVILLETHMRICCTIKYYKFTGQFFFFGPIFQSRTQRSHLDTVMERISSLACSETILKYVFCENIWDKTSVKQLHWFMEKIASKTYS